MMSKESDPKAPTVPAMLSAALMMRDQMRSVLDTLEGEVAHLRRNGWTDEQARAIVATMFGWRAPASGE